MNRSLAIEQFEMGTEAAQSLTEQEASPLRGVAAWELDAEAPESERDQFKISRGDVSLCLLVNRRTQSMRIIDFRAGPQAKKFDLVREIAEREGICRVYTVVEREESNTWLKMGFEKEGTIPGFYKRSDGYILGMEMEREAPLESGTRIKISQSPSLAVSDRAERAYQAGRRLMRNRAPETMPKVKVTLARSQDIDKAFKNAVNSGRALTGLEDFGRDVEKDKFLCTARGGFSLLVGVEVQPCFDNAFVEAVCAPRGDKETWLTAASFKKICEDLKANGVVSVFAISSAESVELTAAWVTAGFRRTGRLPRHMTIHGQRADAFLWSRRLCEPS